MSSREILKTKLIELLEQDYKSAKLRLEGFKKGTEEYAFNKASMLQSSRTLFDIRMIDRERYIRMIDRERLENLKQ